MPNTHSTPRLSIIPVALLILGLLANTAAPVAAHNTTSPLPVPSLFVTPASGPAGSMVTLDGFGFDPGGYDAVVLWDGADIGKFYIPEGGKFSAAFTVPPDAAPGPHLITVCAYCGQGVELEQSASATFQVAAPDKPTDTPAPQFIPPPVIKSFYLDQSVIDEGKCTVLHWFVENAVTVMLDSDFGNQPVAASADWQVCPAKTVTYTLTAYGDKGTAPESATATTTLVVNSLPQSITPTPTLVGGQPPINIPPPIVTPLPNVTPPGGVDIAPGTCATLDLGPGAVVVDFDDRRAGERITDQYAGRGVWFNGSASAGAPSVAAYSGTLAASSQFDDFGSANRPIVITFSSLQSAVGLYVGREAPAYDREPVYAVLSGYGYDAARNLVVVAQDSVRLPAEAAPIQRCLIVRAPARQEMRSVTLEYVREDGTSVYDRRWMDNLTFVPVPTALVDAPPMVTITTPLDGSNVPTNSVLVTAQINEDVRLASVTITVNGGSPQAMTFGPEPGGDPTRFTASITLPGAGLRGDTPNGILVAATDWAGQEGQASASFRYNPGGAGDLSISGVEVTQGIQTYNAAAPAQNNLIPLIGYKRTVVRVYVLAQPDTRGNWTDVTARLLTGGRVYQPITGAISGLTITADPAVHRLTFNNSFTFLLDYADTATGTRELEVRIYSISGRPEADSANNIARQSMTFGSGYTLSMYGATYGNTNATLPAAPWSDFEAHRLYTLNVFPLTNFFIMPLPGNPRPVFDDEMRGQAYLRAREWAERILARYPADTRLYLLQPEDTCSCGVANRGLKWMNGHNNRGYPGEVMAQELAHSLGLWWHAAGTHAADDPRGDFPYYHDSIGRQVGLNTIDPNNLQIVTSTSGHVHDIMSYGGTPTWVSPYTYCELMRQISGGRLTCSDATTRANNMPLPILAAERDAAPLSFKASLPNLATGSIHVLAARRIQQEQTYLYVAGTLNRDGTASFAPFEMIASAQDIARWPEGAAYRLRLEDRAGTALGEYPFDPVTTHGNPGEPILFSLIIPFDPATARITLLKDDAVLAERLVSPNYPQIRLLSPNGNESWPGQQAIAWEANDPDSDPLTYTVEYSTDGGQTWMPLDVLVTGNSVEVDFDSVPGSDRALVRVLASDGVNTAGDQSDAPFSVPRKGPQITLIDPAEGATFFKDQPFYAEGTAFDWEDGPIENQAPYVWTSDKDGALGSGPWIVLSTLSAGEHTLTLTVTDSDSNATTASVNVKIVDPSSSDVTAPSTGTATDLTRLPWLLYAVFGAAIFGVLVAGILIVFVLRRR